jgi:dynein heavy chain
MLLTHALQDGSIVLVENAAEVTSPSLISILRRELSSSVGTSQLIKFNDNQVEFDQHFFCYICSQYSNPHFSPEVH